MVYSKLPDSIPIVDFNDFKQRKRLAHLFTFSFSDKITNFSFRTIDKFQLLCLLEYLICEMNPVRLPTLALR